MKHRVIWIDWAKTIFIYLMVVGHCFPIAWENQLIYAFHMPAFFIISGYLYKPHHWIKTLKSFGVPILFFSTINFIIYAIPKIVKRSLDTSHLAERMILPFWGPGPEDWDYIILFPGVWFIIALFMCRLFMGDIKIFAPIREHKYISLTILLGFLIAEPYILPHNLLQDYKFYRVIPSLPFVLLGYSMKDWFKIEDLKIWTIPFLVGCFILMSFFNGYGNILNYKFGISYGIFFITALFGSIALYSLCSKLPTNHFIVIISSGTMMILAMNFNLKILINFIFTKLGFPQLTTDQYIFPWIISLLIVVICYYPIQYLIKHAPVLLGK